MSGNSFLGGLLAGILGAGLVLGAQFLMKPGAPAGTTDMPEEFGTNVREYLIANPDVIIEALQKQQEKQQQAQLDAARETIRAESAAIFTSPASPSFGDASGVNIVEFFDYNCGYCRRNTPVVQKLLSEDSATRIVYKELPILGPESLEATKVALAAYQQSPELYKKIHAAFLSAEGKLTHEQIEKIARDAGADWAKILADKESEAVGNEIKANYELAQKLNLTGTPGFIVGDQFLPGAQDETALKTAINAARKPTDAAAPQAAPSPVSQAEPTAPVAATPDAAPAEAEQHAE